MPCLARLGGPGLAIRIPGEVTRDKLDILRKADAVFLDEIRLAGLYNAIWQAFAVLLPVKPGQHLHAAPLEDTAG